MDHADPATAPAEGPTPGPPPRMDPEAFAREFERAAGSLWTVAAAVMGDGTEAEDVLQEAALAALGRLERFEPGTSFLAWTASFVRNLARNRARKRARRATAAAEPGTLVVLAGSEDRRSGRAAPSPEELLAGADGLSGADPVGPLGALARGQEAFDDRLVRALRTLPAQARAALLLRVVRELPYREIALLLDIPEGTATSHVHRARATLRRLLAPESARAHPTPLEPTSARGGPER